MRKKRGAASKYAAASQDIGKFTLNLVLAHNEKGNECNAFVANIMYRYPFGMPERVKEECKHGCGIETGYRRISQMHPHTTSKNACQNNAVLHDNDHVQSANGTGSARQRTHIRYDALT